jgi:hypothetical protein
MLSRLGNQKTEDKTEDGMKRERTLQVVLVVLGLFYSFWGYLLFDDLWHSKWLGTRLRGWLPPFIQGRSREQSCTASPL